MVYDDGSIRVMSRDALDWEQGKASRLMFDAVWEGEHRRSYAAACVFRRLGQFAFWWGWR